MTLLLTLLQVSEEPMLEGMAAMQKVSFKLLIRLLIDLAAVLLLIRFVYFPRYKKRELNFTFLIFNLVIFLISFLLSKIDLSMGTAFGLFAVFSMLRYRTEEVSIKDMTYLFLVIAMGLLSAVTKIKGASDGYEYAFIGMVHAGIILLAFLLESRLLFKKENVKVIQYEKIELIHANRQAELIEDIKSRTGLNVSRISIVRIDFLSDSAQVKVYYFED
jgi:hypothetical protein